MIAFLSKIIKINNLHVVGVVKNDNGESYHVLTIRKKGSKIDIVSQRTFQALEDLVQKTDAKLPVILVANGKGVLHKKIDFDNESDVNWQKNIDYATIYYTSFKSGNSNFISFCRRNAVEETITGLQKNHFHIMDIYVGSFLSALLQHAIQKKTLHSGDLVLDFEEDKLAGFSKLPEPVKKEDYMIGKDSISNKTLPLYGALIHFFLKPSEVSKTKNESLNVEEILYKKAFNFFGAAMLVGFLVSLLTSYLLIQYYGSKNAELNLQNVYSNQSYQKILDLEQQKENKLSILKESGFLSPKFLSYYGYELMKGIPSDLSLNEINIIPSNKEVKANKKMLFESKTIIVKGETFNESSFNDWMEGLKKMQWIGHFEIISLKKDKKNKSQFEIKITLKNV